MGFSLEIEKKIHERQGGLCACCRGVVHSEQGAEYREVLPEKYTGKEFGSSHENGVLVHEQCRRTGEKSSELYPHTHNNPGWVPGQVNESTSHAQWRCRINAREARGQFQESVNVDRFRREHRRAIEGRTSDERVLENNRAAKEYVDHGGHALEGVNSAGRERRLARKCAEMDASGDRWVKVYTWGDESRALSTGLAAGYVCRASQLDGLTPKQMGERLGVANPRFASTGAVVVEFQDPLKKEDLICRGTTVFPRGEPALDPRWPPSKGGSVDQAELKTPKSIDPGKTTYLAPSKMFLADKMISAEIGPMLQRDR